LILRPNFLPVSPTHKSAIKDHVVEENHVIHWDKAKVVDIEKHSDKPDG